MTDPKRAHLSPVDQAKLDDWKQRIKAEWDYRQKLVIYEGQNGKITPTESTTTTTTTRRTTPTTSPTTRNVTTSINTTLSTLSGITVNITTAVLPTPKEEEVKAADSTELLKIIGVTCGALIAFILVALIVIRVCRKATIKAKQRVSVRRPLNPQAEEHIYAEIEPLQIARHDSPSGASGASSSSGVPLPKKKEKRVSSFRKISTRIARWLSSNTEDEKQTVAYNNDSGMAVLHEVPEPPERNIVRPRPRPGGRLPSAARPLLRGDSDISNGGNIAMRDHVYNPLQKRQEEDRASGPYDHLRLSRNQSGKMDDSEYTPSSPHDYFVLEGASQQNTLTSGLPDNNVNHTVVIEKDRENHTLDSVAESKEEVPDNAKKSHDYFVLEPPPPGKVHPSPEKTSGSDTKSTSHTSNASDSATSNKPTDLSSEADAGSSTSDKVSPVKGGEKPVVKPRAINNPKSQSSSTSPVHTSAKDSSDSGNVQDSKERIGNDYQGLEALRVAPGVPGSGETGVPEDTNLTVINESKGEDYVLAKMGLPPVPPEAPSTEDDYLMPQGKNKSPDYLDVLPLPPPRTTSKQQGNVYVPLEESPGKPPTESEV